MKKFVNDVAEVGKDIFYSICFVIEYIFWCYVAVEKVAVKLYKKIKNRETAIACPVTDKVRRNVVLDD